MPPSDSGFVGFGSASVTVLTVQNPPPAQSFQAGVEVSFQLPASTFVVPTGMAEIGISVVLVDGSPLPAWLSFDPVSGSFHGTPPPGFSGNLAIRVIARDGQGHEAETTLNLRVGVNGAGSHLDTAKPIFALGRPSLAEQFARHGHARHQALLEHAARAAQPRALAGETPALPVRATRHHTS